VNVTLLARDLVLGKATAGAIVVVVASTVAFGALALSLAARLYDSERLLAADEGTLGLAAWVKRLLGLDGTVTPARAEPRGPTPGHALALFGVAYVLMFFLFIPLQTWRMAPGLALTEWGGLMGIVIIYARGTGRPLADVLRLRPVRARALLGAALVGGSAWAVVGMLAEWIMPAPPELVESLRRMVAPSDGSRGLVLSLALMAVTPAICEEALFRGAILGGFSAKLPKLTSAVITGALFGLYHIDLWRIVPTALLGFVLSVIVLEADSIVPAMLTHFINNACLVVLAHLGKADTNELSRPAQAGVFVGALAVSAVGVALLRKSATGRTTV
jgi:sodium transport system permease protein